MYLVFAFVPHLNVSLFVLLCVSLCLFVLICAYLCLFVPICAYLCLFVLICILSPKSHLISQILRLF